MESWRVEEGGEYLLISSSFPFFSFIYPSIHPSQKETPPPKTQNQNQTQTGTQIQVSN